jgi:diguanylate cyclase (GGDEF)-like protein
MQANVRRYDYVGRYGGEEFLIVAPNCDDRDAVASAERIRKLIGDSAIITDAGSVSVTVSVGLIATTWHTKDLECSILLRMADEALYRAKRKGRNRVELAFLWGSDPKAARDSPSGQTVPVA